MRARVPATLPSIAVCARVAAVLCSVALGACATTGGAGAADPHALDVSEIRAARQAQNEAIAVGDPDGIAAFWTEDVTARPGLGPPISGRDAYRKAFASDAPGVVFVRRPETISVSDRWPLAFETGDWSWHLAGAQSPAIVVGRYSAQWIKRNGRWLIRSEVFVPLHCEATGCNVQANP